MSTKCWIILPCAGKGSRFDPSLAKQYHLIAGQTILARTLACFTARDDVAGIVLVLAEGDEQGVKIAEEAPGHAKILFACGGKERSDSVLSAVRSLKARGVDDDTLVAVHDVARPLVTSSDLDRLFDSAKTSNSGALLASPCVNTLKRIESNTHGIASKQTLDRSKIWQALTPQAFRLGLLEEALEQALVQELSITDDASAVEALGLMPVIVEGDGSNIKITTPNDKLLAEFYLSQRDANNALNTQ